MPIATSRNCAGRAEPGFQALEARAAARGRPRPRPHPVRRGRALRYPAPQHAARTRFLPCRCTRKSASCHTRRKKCSTLSPTSSGIPSSCPGARRCASSNATQTSSSREWRWGSSSYVLLSRGGDESFTTRVTLSPPQRIDVAYFEGPFKYLNNHWVFEPDAGGGCEVDFFVDFEFRSHLFGKAIGIVFNEAVQRMVSAFEKRARSLYD